MNRRGAFATFSAATLALALGACVPRTAPPPTAPPPAPPAPLAPAPAPPAPSPVQWEDAPLRPGDWFLASDGRPAARFGAGGSTDFLVRCEAPGRISLVLPQSRSGSVMTFRTSTGDRSIAAAPGGEGLTATVQAADPLLDSLVFSRGRFAVEAAGGERLILPAWPEPARVIEDCRV